MRAVDELWLICGTSPDVIAAMTPHEVAFWRQRAAEFFNSSGSRAAPHSAVAAEQARQIEQYIRGFRS